jgi:hypothetical protein
MFLIVYYNDWLFTNSYPSADLAGCLAHCCIGLDVVWVRHRSAKRRSAVHRRARLDDTAV